MHFSKLRWAYSSQPPHHGCDLNYTRHWEIFFAPDF